MNDHISNLLRSRWTIPTSVGFVAFTGGIGLGYILGKRKVPAPIVTQYVYQPKSVELNTDDDPVVSDEGIERMLPDIRKGEAIIDGGPLTYVKADESSTSKELTVDEPVITNVFAGRDNDWDYEAELSTRTAHTPYVIHADEYFGDEMDYNQSTFTYYNGDDILTDEEDVPIYNYAALVGELKFGHGSKDPNVVYVRNESRKAEYEIMFSQGHYAGEILGLEVERDLSEGDLKHSAQRFRSWD